MHNHERFVQLALKAFDKAAPDIVDRNYFELHLRRMVMQEQPDLTLTTTTGFPGVTIKTNPDITAKQMLHG
jgi:hypothetical protein